MKRVTRGNLAVAEVSTLRQALLGRAAVPCGTARFQGRRETRIQPDEQSGVYCVREGEKGNTLVSDLGSVFNRGPDLQTVQTGGDVADS